MLYDPEELKGKLYELGTVDIRSVLRWLNNNHKRTIDAALLASIRHEAAYRHILEHYPLAMDKVEAAYLHVIEAKKPPPTVLEDEIGDIIGEEMKKEHGVETPKPPPGAPPDQFEPGVLDFYVRKTAVIQTLTRALDGQLSINNSTREITAAHDSAIDRLEGKVQGLDDRLGTLNEALVKGLFDVQEYVREEMKKTNAMSLTITFVDDKPPVNLGIVHRETPRLIKYLQAGCNVFLTGPAGSGKSTGAQQAAEALGLKFYATSVCQQTTETKFLGYMDAGGVYHATQFRQAYEFGGVYLVDEIDAGNPNVLAVLNAALSNKWCAFADKMVERHPNFRCIAAGNTWGTGRTIQYVGRNPIDAATLNRFVYIMWDYDEALETTVAGLPEWSGYVQSCRAEIKRRGVNFLITPRASIYGAALLRAGVKVDDVVNDVLLPNLDPDIRRALPEAPVISV